MKACHGRDILPTGSEVPGLLALLFAKAASLRIRMDYKYMNGL